MGKVKARLLIAAITLATLTVYGPVQGAGAEPGRPGGNVPTTPVVAARLAVQGNGTDCDACCDTSDHTVRFVTVAPGVQLEVLDWGGTGEPLVLLTGLGDNAHVFDDFAYQFTDRFHVIGITRRGFGKSSQPASGYDLDTRARDDIAVLDALNIRRANFVGHSIAGTEIFKLGAAYPERVKRLVTLDGLDNAWGGWSDIPQPPLGPDPNPEDLQSLRHLAAYLARFYGNREPLAALCNSFRTDPSGRVGDEVTPPEISSKINEGLTPAEYRRIKAPMLGIFNKVTPQTRMAYYSYLDPAQQAEFRRSIRTLSTWTDDSIRRFRRGVKHGCVIELPYTNHYVFIVEEWLIVREVRAFLLER